jgi:hypothetical protein
MAVHILNKKAQINFGFIIAVVILVGLIISATTGILNIIPGIKHEAEAAAMEPRVSILSKLLLDDPGYPAEWYAGTVQRVGLLHYNTFTNKSILGQINSSKLSYIQTLTYNNLAHQLGIMNETSFRLRIENTTIILDINNSMPGGTSSVYVVKRFMTIDNQNVVNVTLEVWE